MLIKIEDLTPKHIINFYTPRKLCRANQAKLFGADSVDKPQIVQNIFDISGVERCLVSDTLLSIFYKESAAKDDLCALVLAELDDYLSTSPQEQDFINAAADIDFIEALADAFIRPTLNRDKGDISIISYQNNSLLLQFTGHCAGCPYAQNTLNNVIAGCFRQYIPQLKDIQVKA